jgi:hypothetical protein
MLSKGFVGDGGFLRQTKTTFANVLSTDATTISITAFGITSLDILTQNNDIA